VVLTKLKIGVLLDTFSMPFWMYTMLERIQQSGYAEITLVVKNATPGVCACESLAQRVIDYRNRIFFQAYMALEGLLFKHHPNAFELKDATALFLGMKQVNAKPRQTLCYDYIEGEALDTIRQHGVDVFIRFGFRELKGDILRASRYGIWSFQHGDGTVNNNQPPGFWEVLDNRHIISSVLQIQSEDINNGLVVYRSFSANHHPLLSRSLNHCYWKSVAFFPRKLKELHELGEERFFARLRNENRHPCIYSSRLNAAPRMVDLGKFLIKQLAILTRYAFFKLLFREQWILWYDLRDGFSTSLHCFKKFAPPKDRFWADPFILHKDGTYYIFMEEFRFGQSKAHISVMSMDEKGTFSVPVVALERPYHLSYPFVFEWQGAYYMLPETAGNRAVELYICVEFPHKWVFHRNLMENIDAVDATLFEYNGKWWMFTNVKENIGASSFDELFLFYSDSPISGHWISHPCNPVISDVRRARPAGKIFRHNGGIYRPSQDCAVTYGYGLNLNQIITLSETEYEERTVCFAKPGWDKSVSALHTLNHVNRLTVIDAMCKMPKKIWYVLVYGLPSFFALLAFSPDILIACRKAIVRMMVYLGFG
jgi:hypothetical protein